MGLGIDVSFTGRVYGSRVQTVPRTCRGILPGSALPESRLITMNVSVVIHGTEGRLGLRRFECVRELPVHVGGVR